MNTAELATRTEPAKTATIVMEHPEELPEAMKSMRVAVNDKLEASLLDLSSATQAKEAAALAGVNVGNFNRVIATAQARVDFYKKIDDALGAGYCIVPNFPVDVIAIRVDEEAKPHQLGSTGFEARDYHYRPANPGVRDATVDPLSSGEGKYVDPSPKGLCSRSTRKDEKGQERHTAISTIKGWKNAIDFPFTTATPRVLDATKAAMAFKIFDEIGVCPQSRRQRDPMVIGKVRMRGKTNVELSFLIAWWLPPEALP